MQENSVEHFLDGRQTGCSFDICTKCGKCKAEWEAPSYRPNAVI